MDGSMDGALAHPWLCRWSQDGNVDTIVLLVEISCREWIRAPLEMLYLMPCLNYFLVKVNQVAVLNI